MPPPRQDQQAGYLREGCIDWARIRVQAVQICLRLKLSAEKENHDHAVLKQRAAAPANTRKYTRSLRRIGQGVAGPDEILRGKQPEQKRRRGR